MKKRLIVGISGASGVIYGIRLLEILKTLPDYETHLVISPAGKRTILIETDYAIEQVEKLADALHIYGDIAASIASGSYQTIGMAVAPCSMKTLSGIANSYADNLLLRAADVTLKDQRKLVLLARETPLHLGHVRLMGQAIEMGAVMMPAMPAFYHRPQTIDDLINHTVSRLLDLFGIQLENELINRWEGDPTRHKKN